MKVSGAVNDVIVVANAARTSKRAGDLGAFPSNRNQVFSSTIRDQSDLSPDTRMAGNTQSLDPIQNHSWYVMVPLTPHPRSLCIA